MSPKGVYDRTKSKKQIEVIPEQPQEVVPETPIVAISVYPTDQGYVTHTFVIQGDKVVQQKIDDPDLKLIAAYNWRKMTHFLLGGQFENLGLTDAK